MGEMEYWDIYDKDKKLTGRKMLRNDWKMADDDYHLSVLGVIMRPDGRFLITQRQMDKEWAPGWWEIPGGGVTAGETSEEAVIREVLEETGLDVRGAGGGFMFDYKRENPGRGNNYFVDIYRFELDFREEDLHFQEAEVLGWKAATADEIRELADRGIFLHYDSIKKVFEV